MRISADNRRELLDEAVRHVVGVHHHEDTPQFRYALQRMFRILEEDACGRTRNKRTLIEVPVRLRRL